MPRFELRYAGRTIELPTGEFVVGRSSDCELVVNDELVSRRHALFRVEGPRLSVEDLQSRNGIEVNGTPPDGPVELRAGDVVTIGRERFEVAVSAGTASAVSSRLWARTIPDAGQATGLGLRGQLIEKVFAVSTPEEAEGVVRGFLNAALAEAARAPLAPEVVEEMTRYCLRLAALTGRPSWIDAVFELYLAAERVMPATLVDELHPLVRKSRYVISAVLRDYVAWLQTAAPGLSPAEKFALQRVEGLARMSSS